MFPSKRTTYTDELATCAQLCNGQMRPNLNILHDREDANEILAQVHQSVFAR